MDNKPVVGVVVVNYNGGALLKRAMASLQSQTRKPDRIILVDNASLDQPIEVDEPWLSEVELIRLNENIGFAAANNRAIERLTGVDWVALLNPDAFAEPDWLEHLLFAADRYPEVGSFSCRMLDAVRPEILDGAGDVYCVSGRAFRRGHGERASRQYLLEEEVFAPCAGAALYRASALIEVGGFDEDFFCYMEDVDLGFRLRLLGYRCVYVPQAVVRHVGSAITGESSPFTLYHGHRNLVWVFLKNMPLGLMLLYGPLHLLLNVASLKMGYVRGQFEVMSRAKVDAFKGFRKVFKKRKIVQSSRRAGALALWQAMSGEPALSFCYWIKKARKA